MIEQLKGVARRFWQEEDGAAMAEYGILVAVIALVAVAGAVAVGTGLDGIFGRISNCLSNTANCNN
ncbi:MAG: Flp family type IVb pilin [Alphaproteobacteria bacterium GM202ARS2]|nr:Flp family type IVb pilin [Alphaproteobacteria bacterium GM202ARS2]